MGHPLDGAESKINRAGAHLDSLNAEVGAFYAKEPYVAIPDRDPEDGGQIWRAKIVHEPPPIMSLLIGEIVYNLRSALDHIAWQLALLDGSAPGGRTQFPIFSTRPIDSRQIVSIPAAAAAAMERLQPYHRGKNAHTDPLWILHELNRIDKHQTIHVVGMQAHVPPQLTITFPGTKPPVVVQASGRVGIFNDGDILIKAAVVAGSHKQVDLEPEFSFRVAFDQGSPAPGYGIIETLLEVHNYVVHFVGPAFLGFFPPRQAGR